jgi:hypothetical protein
VHASGTYFDGKVALGHPALIEGDGMVLVIRDGRGREMTRWRPDEVRLAYAGVKRTDLRLKRLPPHQDRFVVADAHDARIEVLDGQLWILGAGPVARMRHHLLLMGDDRPVRRGVILPSPVPVGRGIPRSRRRANRRTHFWVSTGSASRDLETGRHVPAVRGAGACSRSRVS